MLTKRLSALFALALVLLLLLSPAAVADEGSGWLGGTIAGIVCGLLFLLAYLAVWLYVIYFLYTDANARGQNGVLWAVIGFFTFLLGLIIWLIMRPEKKM